ncbi:DihydroCaffeic Acid Receptor [Ditylenchus destructor]|nr:DihydroCaffeic Acid Receptor [Ditylenchus destructor]
MASGNPYFKNYTNHSSDPTTSCFENVSIDPNVQATLDRRRDQMFKVYHGLIALPLALVGLVLTLIYITAVYRAIRQHRVSRKCYVLLLNRALGDVLACLVALTIVIYALGTAENINKNVMQLLDVFFVGCFWSAMVSYVSLSVLKLFAICKPLQYRNQVTMRRCIYLMILSWLVFLALTIYAVTAVALTKIPSLNQWSGCKVETCTRIMLAKFFHRRSVNANTNDSVKRLSSRFPLWKLALNVATFAGFNLFYVIWGIVLLLNRDRCFFQRNYTVLMRLLGLIRASLLLRIVMDPLLAFITDLQIRRSTLALLRMSQLQIFPYFSTQRPSEEENSSEFTSNPTVQVKISTSSAGGDVQPRREISRGAFSKATVNAVPSSEVQTTPARIQRRTVSFDERF